MSLDIKKPPKNFQVYRIVFRNSDLILSMGAYDREIIELQNMISNNEVGAISLNGNYIRGESVAAILKNWIDKEGEFNMKTNYIFLEPVRPHAYRRPNCDIPIITGLVHVEPDEGEERLCFEVTYEDGFKDYVSMSDVSDGSYKFVV